MERPYLADSSDDEFYDFSVMGDADYNEVRHSPEALAWTRRRDFEDGASCAWNGMDFGENEDEIRGRILESARELGYQDEEMFRLRIVSPFQYRRSVVRNNYASKFNNTMKYDQCCICLDDFQDGVSSVLVLECGHIFHNSCIQEWFSSKDFCPMCRKTA